MRKYLSLYEWLSGKVFLYIPLYRNFGQLQKLGSFHEKNTSAPETLVRAPKGVQVSSTVPEKLRCLGRIQVRIPFS
jgi:hypothetical protein